MTASMSSTPATRRERNRRAMIAEIKQTARQQILDTGAGALSLRGIARQMGTASSALFRYFASYDELITALCLDAYNSLADALAEARERVPADDPTGRWWAICLAYRAWALANRADFALIFGTPLPGYQAPAEITGPAAGRSLAVALHAYAEAVSTGAADPNCSQVSDGIGSGELLPALLAAVPDTPPRYAAITLTAWVSLLGFLIGEIFGSLTRLVNDTDALYIAHAATVMLGMGFDPTHIRHLDTPTSAP